ncbi:uncharacterized protein LOC144955677 isoform X2 [Lampetra fluviatilis]
MLPTSREVEVNVSVRHMYLYSREVRGVVARLRAECGSLSVHAVALAHTQGGSGITPQPLTWGRGATRPHNGPGSLSNSGWHPLSTRARNYRQSPRSGSRWRCSGGTCRRRRWPGGRRPAPETSSASSRCPGGAAAGAGDTCGAQGAATSHAATGGTGLQRSNGAMVTPMQSTEPAALGCWGLDQGVLKCT